MKEVRKIRIEGDVAYVPLTKGYTSVIDASDVHMIDGYNWSAQVVKRKDGSIYVIYAVRHCRGKSIALHRVIANARDEFDVDHIDSDGLNNRKYNLRIATTQQNMANRRTNLNNKSGFKGVSWNKKSKKWYACISFNHKTMSLGLFKDINDAAAAYRNASDQLFGEFSR